MNKILLILIVAVLTLSTLACSFTVNVPTIETGPDQTYTIQEPDPEDKEPVDLSLQVGAANIELSGGASGLVEGTVIYNLGDWEPKLTRADHSLEIHQGKSGDVGGFNVNDIKNEWDLKLTQSVPLDLSIEAGAYTGRMDLSGVPLRTLEIHDGASDNTIQFNTLNPYKMESFEYLTGASTVRLEGLANANAKELNFSGGAGTYTLDFTGELQQDMNVKIDAGVSTIRIIIPANMNVEIDVIGEMKTVATQGTWTVSDTRYTAGGEGPLLSVEINTSLGTLTLEHEK